MWKDNNVPISLNRWVDGCKQVNEGYLFNFYDDNALKLFVMSIYPDFLEFYMSLKGVFMADMARFLIIYHYGGIYMDLDFYCHKPFDCLIASLYASYLPSTQYSANHSLFVVSLEPLIHAKFLRSKSRVVIQDFFLSSPRHPFVHWLLHDRLAAYKDQKARQATNPKVKLDDRPFSFSIEDDIDRYRKIEKSLLNKHMKKTKQYDVNRLLSDTQQRMASRPVDTVVDLADSNHQKSIEIPHINVDTTNRSLKKHKMHLNRAPSTTSFIVELPEAVLHPLLDQANGK